MRISLICVVAIFCANFCFAEKKSEGDSTLETGVKYFLRSDFDAAKAMFNAIPKTDKVHKAIADYYLGSIEANKGSKTKAYSYFAKAASSELVPMDIRQLSALQFAKLAEENRDFALVVENLAPIAKELKNSSLLDFYIAKAKLERGESSDNFSARLVEEFEKDESDFADAFADFYASGNSVLKKIANPKAISNSAKARLQLMQKKDAKLESNFTNSTFWTQLVSAENGSDVVDWSSFEKRLEKHIHAPFAWRAAFVLAKKYFKDADYKKSAEYAELAEGLASPDLRHSWKTVMLLADAQRMLKDYDAARENYFRIAGSKRVLGEPQAQALYKLGVCWYDQREWNKAHQYFERVFVVYFHFEYWGARAYYYDARALLMLESRRDAAATLLEYFKRAKDKKSQIYKDAKKLYKEQYGSARMR